MEIGEIIQFGLTNAVVVGIAGWIGKIWADKYIEKIKGEQAKSIEAAKGEQSRLIEEMKGEIAKIDRQFQSKLERQTLVFRTHFELEFGHYQSLWMDCDNSFNIAAQTLQWADLRARTPEAAEEHYQNSISRYDEVREALDRVRKLRPFIEQEIADSAVEMMVNFVRVTEKYKNFQFQLKNEEDAYGHKELKQFMNDELDGVEANYDNLALAISSRINGMYVND